MRLIESTLSHRAILTTMVAAFTALGLLYAIYTPKWQAPDEPAHFNYIRTIAETGRLPILQPGDYDQDYLEKIKAAKFPAAMPIDTIRYESYQPPLYYLAAAPVYLLTRTGGLDAQVVALRLFSVGLGIIVLLVAFAIVREIFPDDHLLALATVGLMATVPQHIAVSASISNDLAAELVVILILWLVIKRIQSQITNRQFAILGGVLFGAGLLTKTTAFVPGAILLISAEVGRLALCKPQSVPVGLRATFYELRFTLYTIALAAAISSPMFIRNMLTYGITDPLGLAQHDMVVLGQPTTAEMIAKYGLNHIVFDFFAVTFKSFWAQFGWMGVLLNDRLYVILIGLVGAAGLGLVLYALRILRHRDSLTLTQWSYIGLLALLLVTAVADYVGYNFKFFQLQGRYVFPALIAIAFFLVTGLRELIAREYQRTIFALLYVAFLGLALASLFLFIVPQLRIAN